MTCHYFWSVVPRGKFAWTNQKHYADLQSWTQVLETVMKYSYFSVISGFPNKTVHPFWNFFAVLPPPLSPTLYKVETRKVILDTRVQLCLWDERRGWACVDWKIPKKCKSVPRLFSMIVGSGTSSEWNRCTDIISGENQWWWRRYIMKHYKLNVF